MSGGNFIFNVAKGSAGEMARDDATKFGMLLLQVVEADATLIDRDTVAAILAAANTEATFTNYGRKTALTATRTVDDTNDRVDLDLPDQTWAAAGGATNNTIVKLIIFYEEAAGDATRIPITAHDFDYVTTGTDLLAQLNAAGFFRAQ